MSDLYRSALSARINKLPQLPTIAPFADDAEDDDEEEEEENDLLAALPTMPPPRTHSTSSRLGSRSRGPNPDLAPISADNYFKQAVEVTVPQTNLVHRVYYTPPTVDDGSIMICHHGAGYSGLSFACFAKEVTDSTEGECGILALDARRHGTYVVAYVSLLR